VVIAERHAAFHDLDPMSASGQSTPKAIRCGLFLESIATLTGNCLPTCWSLPSNGKPFRGAHPAREGIGAASTRIALRT